MSQEYIEIRGARENNLFLFIGATAMTLSGSQDPGGEEGIRGRVAGPWRLAALETEGADGKCTGPTLPGCLSLQTMATCPSR